LAEIFNIGARPKLPSGVLDLAEVFYSGRVSYGAVKRDFLD
jgi:hypothetical protein